MLVPLGRAGRVVARARRRRRRRHRAETTGARRAPEVEYSTEQYCTVQYSIVLFSKYSTVLRTLQLVHRTASIYPFHSLCVHHAPLKPLDTVDAAPTVQYLLPSRREA